MKIDKMVTHRVIGKSFDNEVRALFMYSPATPFSCKILFQGDNIWEFSREALMECLVEGSGGFLNTTFDSDGEWVTINLNSENGSFVAQFPHSELTTFIHMSYDAVPVGNEADLLDIDGLISEILEKTQTD